MRVFKLLIYHADESCVNFPPPPLCSVSLTGGAAGVVKLKTLLWLYILDFPIDLQDVIEEKKCRHFFFAGPYTARRSC